VLSALIVTALISSVFVSSIPAEAASPDDPSLLANVPTNRPDIHAFAAPEPGFDAETASALDLKKHGLPPRPSSTAHPQALSQWLEIVRHAKHAVTPRFAPRPARKAPQFTRGGSSSYNWSGAVAAQPICFRFFCPVTPAPRIIGVEGSWTVPPVEGSAYVGTVSSWVGLDGYGNSQVQQIGTDSTNTDFGFAMYEPWFELFPDSSQAITSLSVAPGDQMFGMVQYSPGSNSIWFYLGDLATNQYTSFAVPAKYGSPGRSAEWIVERPTYNGTFDHPLPPFGTTTFSDMWFWNDASASYPANASFPYTGTLLDMYDNSGTQLDHAAIKPDSANASITTTWLNYQ